jgi:uncharacterized protein YndB with AHSA1/START domain
VRAARVAGAVSVCFAVAASAWADVTDRSAHGFTVKVVQDIAAPPEAVYRSLVQHVGEWWDPEHTYTGAAKNMAIAPRPGGCFCETLAGGGFVEHAAVINAQPARLLRMRGALGPLQEMGVAGTITWQLEKSGAGTKLTFTHAVGGYAPGGLDKVADVVDTVLTDSVKRLKEYAER